MRELLRIVLVAGFTAIAAGYATALLAIDVAKEHYLRTSPLLDQNGLEQVVAEEKVELGLNKNIGVEVKTNIRSTYVSCFTENDCTIFFRPDEVSRYVVRHELYHVKKDDPFNNEPSFKFSIGGKKFGFFHYSFLVQQPRADLYAITGWRL